MNNVGLFLFDDVELLDFAGPYEVFSVTSELSDYSLFRVFSVSEDGETIRTGNGLKVVPDFAFDNHPEIDILIIPGGVGTKKEMDKSAIVEWVRWNQDRAKMTVSVCSGARILARMGLLDGLEITTHHEVFDEVRRIAPSVRLNPTARFIDNGRILTAGGISAGIDASLHIIRKLHGEEIADRTARYMEYGDWRNLPEENP
ncbi:MAG: DJ-1/PfpI family protein [Synergistaceae bacterium]|nr:DJ-1/PfpI family protein [Synergistaceae bacterium]